jgi:hypothetical protein
MFTELIALVDNPYSPDELQLSNFYYFQSLIYIFQSLARLSTERPLFIRKNIK